MDGLPVPPPARFVTALAIATGLVSGIAATALGTSAAPRSSSAAAAAVDATHLPALLRLPGEHVRLRFDAFCSGADSESADESACEPTGSVFVRSRDGTTVELPLRADVGEGGRQLVTDVPDTLTSSRDPFSYWATVRAGEAGVILPPAGRAAPYASVPLADPVTVDLGEHRFGAFRQPDARVAAASWGTGRNDVGLEQGRTQAPIGASSFDVDATGRVYVLDEAHHRVLEWVRGHATPTRIPVAVSGTIADLSVDSDGSLYALETVVQDGSKPVVRRFDDAGRELEAIDVAERTASQLRVSPSGPVVLEQPAQQWMPVLPGGVPATPAEQRRLGSTARPLTGGRTLTLLRVGNEIRIALTTPGGPQRSWRVVSGSELAEVQLAEPLGKRVVVVARVYRDDRDEFVVLVLSDTGLAKSFAVASHDWAETAPLTRFRLVGSSLYQLGSTPTGVFVDRYDLGVRP